MPGQLPLLAPETDVESHLPQDEKARGAFFTPQAMADFISDWAIRTKDDRVLEPSCGEAAFLISAGRRLRGLGATSLADRLLGVDIHGPSATAARDLAGTAGLDPSVEVADFFDFASAAQFDAVIGNPPYVRYQQFTGSARIKARAAALAGGVRLTQLASSWAAFTIHAAAALSASGRLGLVLPAELLSVNYAGPVRDFLLRRFSSVRLVVFEERVFPGALEEVVLLLAEGDGGTDRIEISRAHNLADVAQASHASWSPTDPQMKWTPALLDTGSLTTYQRIVDGDGFAPLIAWGETDLGMVSGNNRFFALSPERAGELGISDGDLLPISPPGSGHLRGLSFTSTDWKRLGADGKQTVLFRPPRTPRATGSRAYIEAGERDRVHHAYKCRVREPWWRVPLVDPPDLFLTYMNHDAPRIVRNDAAVTYLNSVHGIRLNHGLRLRGRRTLPIASLNTLTLLGAELVGRSYGGGLLKIEPREADQLPVPTPELVAGAEDELLAAETAVANALAGGNLLDAAQIVDDILLVKHLGLSEPKRRIIAAARTEMFCRREARGRT